MCPTDEAVNSNLRMVQYLNTAVKKLHDMVSTATTNASPAATEAAQSPVGKTLGALSLPIVVVAGTADMATAKKGEQRKVAVATDILPTSVAAGGLAYGVTTGVSTGAGVVGGVAIAAEVVAWPLMAATATGMLIKDTMLENRKHELASRIEGINTDLHTYSYLQEWAKTMDKTNQALKAQGKPLPLGELVKQGGVPDLHNEENLKKLSKFIGNQSAFNKDLLAKSQSGFTQMSALPEGLKDYRKELDSFNYEETQAKLDAAASELRALQIQSSSPVIAPGNEMHTIPTDVMHSQDSHTYTYSIKYNTSSVSRRQQLSQAFPGSACHVR